VIERVERVQARMSEEGWQGVVATHPVNVAYLSGFDLQMESLELYAGGHWVFVVVPSRGVGTLILPVSDVFRLAYEPCLGDLNVVTYGRYNIRTDAKCELSELERSVRSMASRPDPDALIGHAKDAISALVSCLSAYGMESAAIGVDEMGVSGRFTHELTVSLKDIRIAGAYDTLREVRMTKTSQEVELLRAAVDITERAIKRVMDSVRPGVSEQDLVRELKLEMTECGASPSLWYVGAGRESALIDREPSDRPVEVGDVIQIDVGCKVSGYFSDLGRTAVLGRPSEKMKTYYGACLEAQQAAIGSIRPGAECSELYREAINTVRRRGIAHYDRAGCGHGIGMDPYDLPIIGEGCKWKLQEGMVINVEVPYREFGFGGLQIEDTVEVTEDGFRYLSTLDRELACL